MIKSNTVLYFSLVPNVPFVCYLVICVSQWLEFGSKVAMEVFAVLEVLIYLPTHLRVLNLKDGWKHSSSIF